MSHHFVLGAINNSTEKYEFPLIAKKEYKYKCPVCRDLVILRKGKRRIHHFAHRRVNNCCFYENPHVYETELHKNAKERLKDILNNKGVVIITNKCNAGTHYEKVNIKYSEHSNALVEYTFHHNDSVKRADVALIDISNNSIQYIFEIYATHKQNNRPEPWFEISASAINIMADNDNNLYEFECIRDNKECQSCLTEKFNRKCVDCNGRIYNKDNTNYTKCFSCFKNSSSNCYKCKKFINKKYTSCYNCRNIP